MNIPTCVSIEHNNYSGLLKQQTSLEIMQKFLLVGCKRNLTSSKALLICGASQPYLIHSASLAKTPKCMPI